jgi:hypothetical protein
MIKNKYHYLKLFYMANTKKKIQGKLFSGTVSAVNEHQGT